MKEKILDKQVLRYVIATTVSGKPTYLKKKLQKIEYSFEQILMTLLNAHLMLLQRL